MARTEKDPTLVRQWMLLQKLSQRHYGMTLQEMAREAGVVKRTSERDVEALRGAGFPIEHCHTSDHGKKHYRIDPQAKGVPLNLRFDEAMALYLGRRLLDPLAGTPIGQSVSSALRKIHASLSDMSRQYLDRMSGTFHYTRFGASDYHSKSDVIDELMIAIEDHEAAKMTYQSLRATEPVTYEVFPFGMVYHHNSLYLIARSSDHDDEIRTFKIDRVEAIERTGFKKFAKPDNFDLQHHLSDSFGVFRGEGPPATVRIRFAPAVARVVAEGQWHPSQSLTRQSDGGLLAEFQLNDLHEITSWILSFGAKATVLDPPHLRETIAEELRKALEGMTLPQ